MKLPAFLEDYTEVDLKGCELGEIIFSQGTYEIEIKEKKVFWPFLQLSDSGEVLDAFCTCKSFDKNSHCKHLAKAFWAIYKGRPLHVEFEHSFWNVLCQIAAQKFGYERKCLRKKGAGQFLCKKGQLSFVMEAQKEAVKTLQDILEAAVATEESSLKFSRLPLEEIAHWRQGNPSDALKYELSFWSDLAKFLFFLQFKESYEVKFVPLFEKELPKKVAISFKNISLEMSLSDGDWKILPEVLNTIKSPLKFIDDFAVASIKYDERSAIFEIESKDIPKGKIIDNWIYVPEKGFYPKTPSFLLEHKKVEVKEALDNYRAIFERYLVGDKIDGEKEIKAKLFFDDKSALHLEPYLEKEGDLKDKRIKVFDGWLHIAGDGFYQITKMKGVEGKVIGKEKMSSFIENHRDLLEQNGWSVFSEKLPVKITYRLTDEGLFFESSIDLPEESFVDLGEWVYIKNKGFYRKEDRGVGGQKIERDKIVPFIQKYRDLLETIDGFFSLFSPIEKIGLDVLCEEGRIKVIPQIVLKEGWELSKIQMLGEIGYLEGRGFFQTGGKIPEEYQKEQIIPENKENMFVEFELPALKPFIVYLDKKIQWGEGLKLELKSLKRKRGLWESDLCYSSTLGSVSAFELWPLIHNHKRYYFSTAGIIDLKESRFQWLINLKKRTLSAKTKLFKLGALTLLQISALENIELPQSFWEIFESLKEFDTSLLKATLRPYQELGFKWLWGLFNLKLSALLCDEMGLGKTHQAMALLAAISALKKGKFLVVAPTSVVYHWEELLKRFLPHLKVALYHGDKRQMTEDCDLLLTSYGILRLEKDKFTKMSFDLAIFDEMQVAKNHSSKIHKTLKKINADMRLGLTGTPLENRLRELKALFDIILPSYLPSEKNFYENFILPIERDGNVEKRKLLTKLIKPFILRRKKSEVLLDLPEKIEEIAFADLSMEQRELYRQSFMLERENILGGLKDANHPVEYLHIFALFSRLKQICDHPSLVLGDLKTFYKHNSPKFDLLIELLDEAHESGQKVVIFSQYLGMLEIIESYLKKKNIGFASIKGATKKRHEEVKRFRDDPECRVFVASLLAAGVGIDLSAASVVIHFDRWWNPAKENQATDRVHRIGQTRGVQVFKLMNKNSIEEHIHALIEKKAGLIEETLGKDDSDQLKMLTREELLSIVEEIAKESTEKNWSLDNL